MRYSPFANPELLRESMPIIERCEMAVKTLIMTDVRAYRPRSATFRDIRELIDECIKSLPEDFPDREKTERELKTSAVVWYERFAAAYLIILIALKLPTPTAPLITIAGESVGGGGTVTMPKDVVDRLTTPEAKERYVKLLTAQIEKLANMPIKDYAQKSSLSIWARSEIDIRRQMHEKQIAVMIAKGDTVKRLSAHADCSKRCEPWQGKLVSLTLPAINERFETGTELNGEKVYSLKAITAVVDKYGYRNNIIVGFNCRHRLVNPDVTAPEYRRGEIEEARAVNKTMRALENAAKKPFKEYQALRDVLLEGKERNAIDARYVRLKYQQHLRLKKRAIAFAKEHNLPVYEWRMVIPAELQR